MTRCSFTHPHVHTAAPAQVERTGAGRHLSFAVLNDRSREEVAAALGQGGIEDGRAEEGGPEGELKMSLEFIEASEMERGVGEWESVCEWGGGRGERGCAHAHTLLRACPLSPPPS